MSMQKRVFIAVILTLLISASGVFAQTSQTITLRPGFNFVSFTTAVSINPSQFKALNASIEDVYLYSAAAGSFLSANEGTLTSLAAGKGYIVKSTAASNISVPVTGTAISTIGNISLKAGFNLVGFSKVPATATSFTQLMTAYSFVQGLYKWSAAAGSFVQVVRNASGVPEKIDGTDPTFTAGESYFFNLAEDTLINYDGTGILMGKTIDPPVTPTENPFAGTYTGTFAGNGGMPQGTFTLTVSTAGVLTGSGYNNSNTPPTAISPSGTVTSAGAATFYVTFTNQHKFGGTFTSAGASGSFYETDGATVKGSWSATKNAVTPQSVATPVITPSGGTFTTAQSVTITCATSGATIKYTTDGSTPSSTAGNTYSSAIFVSSTTVIKAVAIKSGMTDSAVAMATFTIGTQPSGSVPFLRKFGTKGTGNGQFASGPINVAVEASTGYIFVSDTYGHRVLKFDASGNYISAIGSAGTGNGQFQYPTGIAVTGGGEMFVVDYGNKRVQKFTTGGTFLKAFGSAGTGNGQFQAPDCVAVEKYGSVYVTDFQNNNVQRFSSEGSFIQKWGGAGSGDGQFGTNSPKDIAIDSSDNVYVADIGNNRIQKFNIYGAYQTQWGTSGSGSGQFTSPHGVCVDPDGHVFVSDKSCRIQKFSPMGDFILGWGSSGTADGQFTDPSGICADSNGNIYVADFGNSRVQVFGTASTPTVEKVATPSISPAGGTYTTAQSVTITCATSGATIKYTTDGTAPSATNGSVYSSAITVSASATIKAMAYKTGMTDSDVASAVFVINSTTPQPGETITIDLGGVTLKMVRIPAAGRSFLRGSPSAEKDRSSDEGPQHTVNFTKDYYIGKFEVTQSQWLKIYGRWPIVGISDGDDYPAYYVSWDHICGTGGFLEKINALKPGGYDGFRLPTEAEWEYAARAGTTTRFYWGDDLSYSEIGAYAWYTSNSQWAASPVGQKSANAFGLHDMSGNVSEWCYDVFSIYPEGTVTDPVVSSGTSNRVYRGGGNEDDAKLCRSARRAYASSGNNMETVGFRLAMDVPSSAPAQKVQTPSISPAAGTYTSAQSVTITTATSGATIYYTTDGTTPSATNGTVYGSAISVTATKTIKAIAVKTGMTDSDVASASYTIQTSSVNKVKTPVISTVALSSYTIVDLNGYESGVTYYYTLDGSDPSASNGKVWSGKLYIEYTTTVKIIGVKSGYDNSDIATKVVSLPNSTALAGFQSVSGSPLGARQQTCAVAHNGKLWVIGGRGFSADDGYEYKNDVWSSQDGNAWTKVLACDVETSTHFSGRTGHAVVSFANKLWVLGGYNGNTYLNDAWASADGVTWSKASDFSTSKFNVRAHHVAMVFNNKIYLIGGYNSGSYYADVVSSSDGINWTTESSSAGFTARAYHSGTVFNNKMWVVGGATGTTTYVNDVWYSSDGVTWTQATAAAAFTPRFGLRCLAFEDKIWMLGGKDSSAYTTSVYFSNDGVTWKTPSKNPFTAFSGRAYMGVEVFNGKMWVVGGRGPGGSGPDTYLGDIYYSFY